MNHERVTLRDGVSLNVNIWPGNGPGYLLVHGLASNARLWDGVAEYLAGHGLAVAAVDQRGHGLSDKPDEGYDFPTLCDDLMEVVAALVWSRPVAVGQSWGANVVLELAFRQPGDLSGIACVDGGTIELAQRFGDWTSCAAALAPPELLGTRADDLIAMMRRSHPDWPDSGIAGTMANFEIKPDGTVAPFLTRERHMKILHHLYDHHPSERYAHIETPTLLVPAGGGDASWVRDKHRSVEEALASLPRGKARWFDPADHDIHAQFPSQVAEVLMGATKDGFFS